MFKDRTNYKAFQVCANYQEHKTRQNRTWIRTGSLGLQSFLDIKNNFTKAWIILALAIVMGFVNFFLIERTGIYIPGINAIHQAIARLVLSISGDALSASAKKIIYSCLFWGLNIVFNSAFAIFCFKKIGKSFSILTILYIVGTSVTGLLLSMCADKYGFSDFYIFSNPKTTSTDMVSNHINILPWPTNTHTSEGYKVFIVFFYGLIYSLISIFVSLLIYSLGAGLGGMDWLIFYLYKTKHYSSSKLFFYTGIFLSFFAFFLGTYVPYLIKTNESNTAILLSNMFAPTFLATIMTIFNKKILYNFFYPQFKFVKVEVFTTKWLEIRNALVEKKFPHSFTITQSLGSYYLRKVSALEFICFSIELSELTKQIRLIDSDCLIISTSVKSVNGFMTMNTNI